MLFYENIHFVRVQDTSTTCVEALADIFTTLVTEEHGGKAEKREYRGLRNLSHRTEEPAWAITCSSISMRPPPR